MYGVSDADQPVSIVIPCLGPGDPDPRSVVSAARAIRGPLGAGETDPRAVVSVAAPIKGPDAPGDGPESEWIVRPPPAAGPGDLQVPSPIVRIKRKA